MKMSYSIKQIIKREGSLVPYDRDRIGTAIFRAFFSVRKGSKELSEALSMQVEHALINTYGLNSTPSVEEIQDIVEKILMEAGHIQAARAYILYRNKHARMRAASADAFEVTDNVPYKKIYEVLRWNIDHSCYRISELNSTIQHNRFDELIRDSDKRYNDEIMRCVQQIVEKRGNIRIIIVAGPSSSGKTTTTFKLSKGLQQVGISYQTINLDNYFFNLAEHPKDKFGDYDYEVPESLDLELINQHLSSLIKGKVIKTPHYDFKAGKRSLNVHEMHLKSNEALLLDSLHGLYEPLTASIPAASKFKVYIETLGQLCSDAGQFMRWADNRLMRRMIRDSLERNLQPEDTLTHWHYVRRSELKNIIPFIKTADFILNSALPYELPILKSKVFKFFPIAVNKYYNNTSRQDAYIRANRIYEFLKPLKEVSNTSCVPAESLIREFIGGSLCVH